MAKQDLLIVSEDGKNIKHYSYQAAEAARRDGKTLIPLRAFQLADGTVKHVSYERSPEMIEQWTAQGLQPMEVAKSWDAERRKIVAQSVAERDAERTAEANAGRWGEAFGNYGLAVGGESVKKFVGNPAKAFVGLSQLTNAGLGWLTSLGGLAPNPVSNLFHGSAAENAKVRESIEHIEEKYLSKSKPVEGQLGTVGKVTHQVTEGVTDLASQILIGGTTGKVATALKGTSAIAPAASVAAPGKLTVGKMVANASKSMVKDGGAAYATMMAGEAAGETLAEAARNKVDPNKAFEIGALDFATSYFLATADAMAGGISQAAGKVGLEKTPIKSWFMNGLKNPSTQATIKRVLRNVAWEGTSEAADQYLHLTRLQDAGFTISQEDKLVAAAQAGLYGAVGGGIAEGVGYAAARSELQVERKKFALQKQLEAEAALARAQAGQPVETSTPGGPARVNPTGSVEMKDGSTVHPDGTMTTVNGVVTDGEGQPMTVRPEAGESETFDLFNLIRNSDLKVYNLPIETIAVNDRIKQFKQDADPTSGVVQGERLTGAYNPIPAKPILVMEFADGHREVVTGRHRIDLAKQNRMAQIPANIIYEKDGWTLEQARMMDAYDNILDGKGSDQDFVNFFRTAKLDEKTLAEHPELYGRKRQAEARLVAEQASEDLYSLFMSKDERMPLDTAAAIAREAPIGGSGYAENIQRAVTRAALNDGIRASDAAIMARSLMQAYRQRIEAKGMQQLDLFGDDESFQLAMTLEAKFASSKVREIETDLRALKQATGKQSGNLKAREALLKKYGLESAEDADGMQRVIDELEESKRRWQNYYSDPELAQQAHAYAKKMLHLDDVAVEMPDSTITTVNQEVTAPETNTTPEADTEAEGPVDDPNQDMLFSPMPRRSKLEPTEMAGRFVLAGEPEVKVDIEKGRTVVSGLETATNPSKAVDAVVAEAREMGTPLTVANPEKLTNTQRAAIETHNASDLKPSEQPLQAKHEDALPRSTLENTLFPNGGQLPVAGSPAAQAGMVPLALHHVVGIYRALAGRYPKVVKDRNRGPQTALGWFKPDTKSIAVRAQLFGLADGSDVNLLKEKLRERGFFRHEDPKWVGSQTNKVVDYEKRVSEQRLRQDLSDLINKRIKAGIHQGVGTKVMAHELWHYIDQLDGVEVREHGNFLGHILNLKKNTARVLPETDFTNNKELVAEATAFIPWWRGTEGTKDIEYFTKHPWEMYAEMGAAFWLDPGSVCEKAPNYFRAMMIGMEAHPLAYDAWMKAQEAIKNKSDLSGLMAKLTETWSREAETERRRLKDRLRHRPREGNVWQRFKEWMSGSHSAMNFHRWATDRHAPIVMVVNNAATEYVKRMKRLSEQGKIPQADYEKAAAAAKAAIEDINYLKVQYTHQYGKSKIYLADLSEKVIQASRKLGVEMDELGKYLHLQRVIEIGDRATALGIDAPTARKALNEMASTLGPAKMKKVRAMAHQFRAIYEQAVINNPQVRDMLGKKNMELLEKNKHYVTMRHVDDAGQVADLHEQLDRSKHAHDPLTLAIAQIAQVGGGLSTEAGYRLRRLTGSFRATSNPVTATAQTAVAIIEAAQKNAVMIDLAQSLQTFEMPDFKLLKPGERAVENERFGVIPFMLNGEPRKMIVPREVADAATERNFNIPFLSAFTRFLNAGHTTNNYTFVPTAYERDLSATAINNKGLMRSPLHFLSAFNLGGVARLIPGKVGATVGGALDLGGYAAMASQFIPPHVMKSISKHPVGKLLFNPSTIEYWTSYGHKMARMIQKGEYEQTLQEAKAAREAGDITKAEELEYCVCMARKALEDGVLLTLRQMRTDDHTKSDLKQLFDRYNIAFEDDVDTMPLPEKLYKVLKDEKQWGTAAWQAARKAAVAYWEGAGNFSEVEEMTTKLAGYCALHNMATDGQQKFSDEKRKQIALQTATMIGSPDFASRGLIAQFIEMSTSAFWNARMRGGIRMVRAAWNSPGAWFAKAAIHAAPTVTALLVSSGVARRLIVRLLTDDDDERKLEGTVGGQVVEALRWQEKALRNVSLYTQRNSRCLPIWSDGETTLSLKLPIPDEAKLIDGSVRAMWNNLGLPSTDPNYNFDEVITTLGQQFAFNPSDRGSLWSFATPFLSPLVFGSNPYETYRNAPMYTEDAFKARFLEPAPFLEQMGKKTWNASPFVQLYRFRTTDGNPGPDALGELQALMRIPGLGPMLMRFASIDSGGRIQTLKEYERMDEAHRAANRLRQESAARKLTAGEPWDEDEARAVLMDYNRVKRLMLNMNKPNAVRTFESLKRIKDPEVMRRAMDSTL